MTAGIPATRPVWSEIQVLDGGANEAVVVPGSRQDDRRYGAPVTIGDAVLVPVLHDVATDGSRELIRLTPAP